MSPLLASMIIQCLEDENKDAWPILADLMEDEGLYPDDLDMVRSQCHIPVWVEWDAKRRLGISFEDSKPETVSIARFDQSDMSFEHQQANRPWWCSKESPDPYLTYWGKWHNMARSHQPPVYRDWIAYYECPDEAVRILAKLYGPHHNIQIRIQELPRR